MPHSILKNLNIVPQVSEVLALKRLIKNEKELSVLLCGISHLVSCIDSKFSHNHLNNIMTLYQNFGVKI
jgi:hypothetical protein